MVEKYINEFLNKNPKIKNLMPVELEKFLKHDVIQKSEFSSQMKELKSRLHNYTKNKPQFDWFKQSTRFFFEREDRVEEFTSYIKINYPTVYKKYREMFFSDWQFLWSSSLNQLQLDLLAINVEVYGNRGLFLIGAYLTTFELFFQLILRPLAFSKGVKKGVSYRKGCEIFIEALLEISTDQNVIQNIIQLFKGAYNPKLRNSLAKHCYYITEDYLIKYFNTDALPKGKFKLRGEISIQNFLINLIKLQALFWIIMFDCSERNDKLKALMKPVLDHYSQMGVNEDILLKLGDLDNLFQPIVDKLDNNLDFYFKKQGSDVAEKILAHQFWEAWLSHGTIAKPPEKITNIDPYSISSLFPDKDQSILHFALFRNAYLLVYELMMQSIIYPLGKLIDAKNTKEESLTLIQTLNEGKFKGLVKGLDKDFRDSLAHNTYYYDPEESYWIFYKFGRFLDKKFGPMESEIFMNYREILNQFFPELAQAPKIVATAQLIKEIFAPETVADLNRWITAENFALRNNFYYFGAVCRLMQAYSVSNEKTDYEVAKVIKPIFEEKKPYSQLTIQDKEQVLAWSLRYNRNHSFRKVILILGNQIVKEAKKTNDMNIEYRICHILLYLYVYSKNYSKKRQIEKRITALKPKIPENWINDE